MNYDGRVGGGGQISYTCSNQRLRLQIVRGIWHQEYQDIELNDSDGTLFQIISAPSLLSHRHSVLYDHLMRQKRVRKENPQLPISP